MPDTVCNGCTDGFAERKRYTVAKKILFAASSGGHLEQLMNLMPLTKKYAGAILTEKTAYSSPRTDLPLYLVRQVNRHEWKFLPLMVLNTFSSLKILRKERPDVIICTGALATVPVCLLGKKLFHAKLIFIESFAKVNSPTVTGKLMYRFADRFYVQWESMLEVYPDAIFLGGIY